MYLNGHETQVSPHPVITYVNAAKLQAMDGLNKRIEMRGGVMGLRVASIQGPVV